MDHAPAVDRAVPPSPDRTITSTSLLADSGFYYDPKTCLPTNKELDYQREQVGVSTGVVAALGGVIGEGIGAAFGAFIGYKIGKSDMESRTQSKERECRDGVRY